MPHVGRVTWIGVRPARDAPMRALDHVELQTDRGLAGDRAAKRAGRKRQVSLMQSEHLEVLTKLLRRDAIDPALLRRNLVVEGVNLRALMRRPFAIGDCVLEGSGECQPCAKMEAALGDGGYSAMRGHGGIVARVVQGGVIAVGAEVRALVPEPERR